MRDTSENTEKNAFYLLYFSMYISKYQYFIKLDLLEYITQKTCMLTIVRELKRTTYLRNVILRYNVKVPPLIMNRFNLNRLRNSKGSNFEF